MVVSNAVTNGNPVHGQSNMEAPGGCVRGCLGCVCGCVCGTPSLGCASKSVLVVVSYHSVCVGKCLITRLCSICVCVCMRAHVCS